MTDGETGPSAGNEEAGDGDPTDADNVDSIANDAEDVDSLANDADDADSVANDAEDVDSLANDADDADSIGIDADELAGIVDLFGALTPGELEQAIEELAFKRGQEVDAEAVTAAIEDAVAAYALVRYEDGKSLLAPGPVAFPTLPANAEDLPHILDIPTRDVDREAAGRAVAERLRTDAARAVDAGDEGTIHRLLDVTYDVEVWSGAVAVDDVRDRLDDALDAE
jgi:hypothetical protein